MGSQRDMPRYCNISHDGRHSMQWAKMWTEINIISWCTAMWGTAMVTVCTVSELHANSSKTKWGRGINMNTNPRFQIQNLPSDLQSGVRYAVSAEDWKWWKLDRSGVHGDASRAAVGLVNSTATSAALESCRISGNPQTDTIHHNYSNGPRFLFVRLSVCRMQINSSKTDLRLLLNTNKKSGFLVWNMPSDSRSEVRFWLFVCQNISDGVSRSKLRRLTDQLSFYPAGDDIDILRNLCSA